jgi:hypothetical protein
LLVFELLLGLRVFWGFLGVGECCGLRYFSTIPGELRPGAILGWKLGKLLHVFKVWILLFLAI